MGYIIIGIIGLVLVVVDYGLSTLIGVALMLADVIGFGLVTAFRENTGDTKGLLAVLPQQLGGVVCDRDGNATGRNELAINDCLKISRHRWEILLGVHHHVKSAGSRRLFYTFDAEFAPADFRVVIGRKTIARLLDNYGGSNCVFYGAKTVAFSGVEFLVAGPRREEVLARIAGNEKLQVALRGVLVEAGFGECRIREGYLHLRKIVCRGDLATDRVSSVLDQVTVIRENLPA